MKNPKISVIMPSLNVATYIKECVKSVMDQTLKDIEIICVDAGSTDGTLEILEEHAAKDSRIRILHSDIRSYGHQMNLAFRAAKGEYIGIVETDDFIEPNMYEDLYSYAKKLGADVVKAPYIEFRNRKNKEICYYAKRLNSKLPEKCFSYKDYGDLLAYHASVWAGIYRRQYLLDNNIYFVEAPGAGYVDVEFRIKTCTMTDKCAWYKTAHYNYRTSSVGSSTNNFKLSVMNTRWKEIHDEFKGKEEEYRKYIAPYLIFDEYLNTLAYIGKIRVTDEERQEIHDNFSVYSEETVKNSPTINDGIKKRILDFKKDPELYYKNAYRFFTIRRLIINVANKALPKGTKRRRFVKRLVLRTQNTQ